MSRDDSGPASCTREGSSPDPATEAAFARAADRIEAAALDVNARLSEQVCRRSLCLATLRTSSRAPGEARHDTDVIRAQTSLCCRICVTRFGIWVATDASGSSAKARLVPVRVRVVQPALLCLTSRRAR